MAVEKMKLVSVVGPLEEFDRIVSEHILHYDIHLENALSMLNKTKGIYPFSDENVWNTYLAKVEEIFALAGLPLPPEEKTRAMSELEISDTLNEVLAHLSDVRKEIDALDRAILTADANMQQLEHLQDLDISLSDVLDFQFVKFRFGRMPKASYKKMLTYLNDIDAFFVEANTDESFVYGVYFMPAAVEEKIDAIFSSLYYERIFIPEDASGNPEEAFAYFKDKRASLMQEKEAKQKEIAVLIESHLADLENIHRCLTQYAASNSVKRLCAHTKESFYVMGWVSERDFCAIDEDLKEESQVMVVEEDPEIVRHASPPIKLKNGAFFRPFEMFIKMYGLPSYNEIDPTKIVAISYILMFGIMFGDVGHGLILAIGGFLLYKIKKIDLAGIMAAAGVISTLFGFVFGAVFGNEEILRQNRFTKQFALLEPMHDITTILIGAVALGVVIILFSMILGVINKLKRRDFGAALFDQNGLAGIVFYVSVLLFALGILLGIQTGPVPGILILITLVLIFLKEPLEKLVAGEKDWKPKQMGEFILEAFFEVFEIVLSFATNTVSYVRLGAFAMAHASMMSVVFILGDMAGQGVGFWVVMVLGNALVMGLEGLIVGIQALRLEFYEMFSRYYEGDGRAFESVKTQAMATAQK